MKKILFIVFVFLSIFIIYLSTVDRKVYYLSLGDSGNYVLDSNKRKVHRYSYYVKDYLDEKGVLEDYVYGYSSVDKRISDIINDIKLNKKYNDYTLKNSLIKADLVTLHLNGYYLFEIINNHFMDFDELYEYVDVMVGDLDKLFSLIREYCKEDIIFIGFNNPFSYSDEDILDVIDYLDRRFKDICLKYNISYISLKDSNLLCEFKYLDERDYKTIGSEVNEIIDKKMFHT